MYIYKSNHYTATINKILHDCIQHAQQNPFELHYLIVDDEAYFEEIILKKTSFLFNIEIVSLPHFLQSIIDHHHETFHKKTFYENIIEIVQLIKSNPCLFSQAMNPFQTAKNILDVFKNFYLYDIQINDFKLPAFSKQKIAALWNLYEQFDKTTFLEHDFVYSLINENDHQHYYFLSSSINNKKMQKIMDRLDHNGHVYTFKDIQDQEEDYSSYVCHHLFDSYQTKQNLDNPFELFKAVNVQEEIKQVVFDLYQSLKNGHCYDFAIYYPDETYYQQLTEILDRFEISYNKHQITENYTFHAAKDILHYLNDHNEDHLLDLLSSGLLTKFQDIRYISQLKRQYLTQGIITDENYRQLKNDILIIKNNTTFQDLSRALITFISQYFVKNEETLSLTASLEKITVDHILSIKEYMQLLDCLMKPVIHYDRPQYDSVYLLSYHQPYSELLHTKIIYCLGLNETIIPQEFKNTKLLLNHEAECIHFPTTYDQLEQHQKQLQHLFSNRHQRIVLCYALRNNDGTELVVSSLIKKITAILPVKEFIKHQLLHQALKEELYLQDQYDQQLTLLNQQIRNYKESKNQVAKLTVPIDHNPLSASKLEVYNQCPYKYFHQYLMNIDEYRDSHLQNNEIGTLIHYTLEKNVKYFYDNSPKNNDKLQQDINQTINDYLLKNSCLKYSLPQNQFFISMIKKDLYNTILVLQKQMAQGLFVLKSCEKKIYEKIDDMQLKGFIDRVDVFQDYIKVIDYKSSQKKLDLKLARLGFKIQMLLYLEMLSKTENIKKGAVLYFNTKKRLLKSELSILEQETSENFFKLYKMDGYSIDPVYQQIDSEIDKESTLIQVKLKKDGTPDKKSKVITQGELDDIIKDIICHIQHLYQEMTNGNISIYPTRSDNQSIDQTVNPCPFCPYRPLCGYDVFYNEDHLIQIGGNDENR